MPLDFVKEYTSANLRRGESSGKSGGKATRFILAGSARELALIEHEEGTEYLLCGTSLANTAAEGLGRVNDGSQKEESLP